MNDKDDRRMMENTQKSKYYYIRIYTYILYKYPY